RLAPRAGRSGGQAGGGNPETGRRRRRAGLADLNVIGGRHVVRNDVVVGHPTHVLPRDAGESPALVPAHRLGRRTAVRRGAPPGGGGPAGIHRRAGGPAHPGGRWIGVRERLLAERGAAAVNG